MPDSWLTEKTSSSGGHENAVRNFKLLLSSKCTAKTMAIVGEGDREQEAVTLNRVIRYVPRNENGLMAMEVEGDARHAEPQQCSSRIR